MRTQLCLTVPLVAPEETGEAAAGLWDHTVLAGFPGAGSYLIWESLM